MYRKPSSLPSTNRICGADVHQFQPHTCYEKLGMTKHIIISLDFQIFPAHQSIFFPLFQYNQRVKHSSITNNFLLLLCLSLNSYATSSGMVSESGWGIEDRQSLKNFQIILIFLSLQPQENTAGLVRISMLSEQLPDTLKQNLKN